MRPCSLPKSSPRPQFQSPFRLVLRKVSLVSVVEVRCNGESYGWEAQCLEDGIELSHSRGLFATRALAVQWAMIERDIVAYHA